MADDVSPQRPLPECLTRFLAEPGPRQPVRRPPERDAERPAIAKSSGPQPSSSKRALQIVLLWALGYNLFGFAIIVLLWRSMN
ncbi:hypothetical protein [Methylobacterium sp. B4]|uniref:hypothetical protein n=1 Tax=Methylobacterium sp. B4 TaxID=1938755 RepID=UPI000D76BB97|nr:hypothetical protein [Methylobacterium sp. B4]PXW54777.1 hypothetical protein BY998_12025 [Methylobacterium sp. B4]